MRKNYNEELDKETLYDTALSFISSAADPTDERERAAIENCIEKRVTRSERLQLLITPEMKDNLKREAKKAGTSVNQVINYILNTHFEKER